MRSLLLALVVAAALAAGAAAAFLDAPSAPAEPDWSTATIHTGGGEAVFRVEVAATGVQRERGLMHRSFLPADAGMVFVFPKPVSGAFWMKSTLIPLDIAFYDAAGTILRIMQMEPCEADPCTFYAPGVVYSGALEVNAGAFRRHGVETGDTIAVRPPA